MHFAPASARGHITARTHVEAAESKYEDGKSVCFQAVIDDKKGQESGR